MLKATVALLGVSLVSLSVQAASLDHFVNVGGNAVGTVTFNGFGPAAPDNLTTNGESYTIVAGGADVWDNRDEYSFAYTEMEGDFDIAVRAQSIENTSTWQKCGIYATEGICEDSRRILSGMTSAPGACGGSMNQYFCWYRTGINETAGASGGAHEERDGGIANPPFPNAWVSLSRRGSIFYCSNSTDGLTWQWFKTVDTTAWMANRYGAKDGPFANKIWVGLEGMVHDSGCKNTAVCEFRDFTIRANFASSRGNPHGIYVTFPNQVDAASATAIGHYTLTGPGTPVILSASVNPNDANQVILALDRAKPLEEYGAAGAYTLAYTGVKDINGAAFADATLTFNHGEGYEARKIHVAHMAGIEDANWLSTSSFFTLQQGAEYTGMPAFTNASLFEDPLAQYPGSPGVSQDGSTTLPQRDNYVNAMHGILVPPATANYRFAVASDDQNALWLSTDDNPANKVEIASVPQWAGVRSYQDNAVQTSAPIHLIGGKKYYLGDVMHEGGGGFNNAVTWDGPPTSGTINNGQSPIPDTYFTPSRFYFGNAYYTLGDVSITTQPAARTNQDATVASFSVRADGTPLYAYQWLTNGAAVPGANNRIWNTALLLPSDNNTRVQVVVGNEFSSVTSAVALLKITVDLTPPTLVKAAADISFTKIHLSYSEIVSGGTTLGNYSIKDDSNNPLAISGITTTDNVNFVLTTAPMGVNTHYTITVNNVKDISSHQNPIAANSTIGFSGWQFCPGFLHFDTFLNINSVNVSSLTNNARFPNSPDESYIISGWSSGWVYTADHADNYGSRFSGYVVAPTSGDYVFSEAADDGHAFWLSPSADFNGLVKYIDTDGACCQNLTAHQSTPITLVGQQMYAFQSVYKEGGGGDWGAGWISVDGNTNYPPAPDLQPARVTANTAPGLFFGIYADPANAPIMTYSPLPADVTTPAGSFLTYHFKVTNSFYGTTWTNFTQWYTNGVPIPGANFDKFVTPRFPIEQDGIVVSVICSAPGRVVSSSSTVHLFVDTVPPTLKYAMGQGAMNDMSTTFDVVFDKPVDVNSAQEAFNYFLDPVTFGTNVVSAVLDADGVTVHITSDFPMHDGQGIYVYNIMSLAGVPIADGSTVPIGINWGFIRQDMYGVDISQTTVLGGTIGGGDIGSLTNNAQYPNYPSNVVWPNIFESVTHDQYDNYGTRISGYLRVPLDGEWYFWTSSDDNSSLYLSTDDSPANAALIAHQPNWNGYRDWSGNGNNTKSAAITLQAGKKYFIEAFQKEGGGGDSLSVAMNQTGGTAGLLPIAGAYLSPYVDTWIDPATPADITTGQCGNLSTSINFRSLPYYQITWFASVDPTTLTPTPGVFSPIGTGPSFNLPGPIPVALDGVEFYAVLTNSMMAVVDNSYSHAMSRIATLHVTAEAPPVLLGASTLDQMTVDLQFERWLDGGSASDPFNYTVTKADSTQVQPVAATLRPDQTSVILSFAAPLGASFQLSVMNVYECTGVEQIVPVTVPVTQWALAVDIAPNLPVLPGGNTNFTYKVGDVELVAGGGDIWDVADQFEFVYNQVAGDFDIKVQVDALQGDTSRWAKAGLMARMTLDANSPTIQVNSTPGDTQPASTGSQIETGVRDTFGDITGGTGVGQTGGWESFRPNTTRPNTWARLQRVGTRFYGFYGTDGVTWTEFAGPRDTAFATNNTLNVGINLTSHNTGMNAKAHFSNFGTTVYAGGSIAVSGQLPATTSVAEGFGAVLKGQVTVASAIPTTEPVTIRWQRLDPTLGWITLGTQTYTGKSVYDLTYTSGPLLAPDAGAQFRFVANVVSYVAVSDPTTINLTAAVAAKVTVALTTNVLAVVAYFDQPMNGAGAAPGWFTLSPGSFTIASVALNTANAKRFDVTLDPSTPLVLGSVYTITAQSGVQSATGMGVDAAHNSAKFTAINFPYDPDQTGGFNQNAGSQTNVVWLTTDNVLPPHTPGDGKLRGFDVRIVQSGNAILQAANDINVAEQMLAGTHPNQGPNLAVVPCFVENDVINYNWEIPNNGSPNGGCGCSYGHIQPDKAWPGINVAPRFNYNDYAMEVLCYLDLKAGAYTMGVNSDDGFNVSQATSAADPHNSVLLGSFHGGRGATDSSFNFIAPADGLYPFRLVYQEGGGGANCEWWFINLADGSYHAVNAAGGIPAYRPTTGPVIHSAPPATLTVTVTPSTCPALTPDFSSQLVWEQGTVPCGDTAVYSQIPAAGTPLAVGQTTVLLKVMTPTGASNGASVVVTVINPYPPIVLHATNTVGLCSLGGSYVDLSYVMPGGCDPNTTLTLTPTNGTFFPLGNTAVAAVATDTSGRKTTNYFTVSVINPDAPQIACPGDQVLTCVGRTGGSLIWSVTALSDCDLTTPTVVCVPPSGSVFLPGQTTVNCTATDASHNQARCSFKVTVIADTEPPTFVTPCPADMTVPSADNSAKVVSYAAPTATDNCAPDLAVICTPASGSSFPGGKATTVNCVATDPAGNSISCSFVVSVGTVVTGPKLHIELSGANAVVSWPKAAGSFQLQSSATLPATHTSAGWANVGTAPVTAGLNWQVTVPATGNKFFQLKPL